MSRFGGGYSSIAAQWVFDSAGLRQIRALDNNRASRRAAATHRCGVAKWQATSRTRLETSRRAAR
jgi:hypothetical protein